MAEAGPNTVSAHRRPLITAAASGALLFALWFVPTAKAEPEHPHTTAATTTAAPADTGHTGHTGEQPAGTRLADTGSDAGTLPYVAGGLAFLGAGGVLVLHTSRNGRAAHRLR